jgi:hypothetical protein
LGIRKSFASQVHKPDPSDRSFKGQFSMLLSAEEDDAFQQSNHFFCIFLPACVFSLRITQ